MPNHHNFNQWKWSRKKRSKVLFSLLLQCTKWCWKSNTAIYSWGLLCLVMTWKMWCPEVFFFFSFWERVELSLPKCHPFSLCVKPTEDWEVLEVCSRKVIHLFIDLLIRLALWRFYQANDEISPSFCLFSVGLLSPPPENPVSVLYPSVAPSITTPCTQVVMQFMGSVLLPYIATGAPPQVYLCPELTVDETSAERWVYFLYIMHC